MAEKILIRSLYSGQALCWRLITVSRINFFKLKETAGLRKIMENICFKISHSRWIAFWANKSPSFLDHTLHGRREHRM
jgi:hypothetical protein